MAQPRIALFSKHESGWRRAILLTNASRCHLSCRKGSSTSVHLRSGSTKLATRLGAMFVLATAGGMLGQGRADKKRRSRRRHHGEEERWLDDGQQGRRHRVGSDEMVGEEEQSRRNGIDPVKNLFGCLLRGVRWLTIHKQQR